MTFGERLKTLRSERGLTQAQLGEQLMLSESTISLYEGDRRSPDQDKIKKIARFFNVTVDFLIGDTDNYELDVIDIFQNKQVTLTAAGQPLTQDQRLSIVRVLDNPNVINGKAQTVPVLGQIRMGLKLLAQDNWEGEIEVPSDIRADFALEAQGDSMIGVGLIDGDYAICRESSTAHSGDIVVALRDDGGYSEATLKFYFNGKELPVLRAANPTIPDIPMNGEWRIAGVLVAIIRKESPGYKLYNSYLAARDINKEKWDPVFEKASRLGIKPEQLDSLLEMIYQTAKK